MLLGLLACALPIAAKAISEEASSASPLVATRITAENFDSHHVGGPDSDAGIDDWFLSNGTICAAVSDPDHESAITPRGGVLIDLGHCGAEDDQFAVLQPMLNLSQSKVVPVTSVEAGTDKNSAWVRTRAFFSGIEIQTTYRLDLVRPTALGVSVRARRISEGGALYSVGAILLHPSGQTPAFSLLRSDLTRSVGFQYPKTDRRSFQSLLAGLISSDLTILVGADGYPPISYGLARVSSMLGSPESSESLTPLASFSVSGMDFTALNTLTSPLWFGETNQPPGLFQLGQLPFMDVAPKTEVTEEFQIWVGDRADVASVTDRAFQQWPLRRGRVDDSEARIHFRLKDGAPISEIWPDPDGRYALRLPPGDYVAEARADGGRKTQVQFSISAAITDAEPPPIPKLVLGESGRVALPTMFTGRIHFLPKDGSAPAVFGDNHLGFAIGDKPVRGGLYAPFVNLAAGASHPKPVTVAPGDYRVIAVQGPEHEAFETELTVLAGETTSLEIPPLKRVVPTPGWISADFHVHSGESFDSSLPQSQQVIAFAASGTEIMVATEHDRIFDPGPAIEASGVGHALRGVVGVEITSAYEGGDSPFASGHLNAFPLPVDPKAYRGGAPNLEGRRVRDAVFDVRTQFPNAFIQMNHPRPDPIGGEGDTYFSHLGVAGEPFDPTLALNHFPNSVLVEPSPQHALRDLDYHGVELMNGHDLTRYRRVRADWFALWLQGEGRIATANSDSHQLLRVVGVPRTYVADQSPAASPGDDAEEPAETDTGALDRYDETRLMASLHAGRAYGTTGPLLRVHLGETSIGGLHAGDSGKLVVEVDAADWVPVSRWRVYVNGERVFEGPIEAGGRGELPLAFSADSFVTVEVEGPREGLYADVLPEFTPFAFTNPIFVDVDGNGRFDAPGLPTQLPTTLTHPDRVQ